MLRTRSLEFYNRGYAAYIYIYIYMLICICLQRFSAGKLQAASKL
jgi:hypothetical protein